MAIDLGISGGYLNALMQGIQTGQAKVDARRRAAREVAKSALNQYAVNNPIQRPAATMPGTNTSGGVGGQQYSNAPTSGDWGNPIGDPNFSRNYLTSIRLPNGQSVLVHKNIAQQAQGFFNELWNAGYKFKDIQTYNKRNVQTPRGRNPNLWSRHSTGLAFDIDPGRNPWGGRYALPANSGQIAAKYGLSWLGPKNGDWMHFGFTAPQWKGISPN